jgi:hypothetical protein
MKNIWIEKTGMSRKEVETLYIETINTLREFGLTENEAREIAKETLTQTIKGL